MSLTIARHLSLRTGLVSLALSCALFLSMGSAASDSDEPIARVHIAVAANFRAPLEELTARFNAQRSTDSAVDFVISSSASGALYQQILHGAPFDLFLSADRRYPQQLAEQLTLPKAQTYALGQLVLWHPQRPELTLADLNESDIRLAIANPKTAPYGRAAKQVLTHLDKDRHWKLITGNSVSQTFQFVHSGNLDGGFVAASQMMQVTTNKSQAFTPLPSHWYSPIEQQGVLLKHNNNAAKLFFDFLLSQGSQDWIAQHGYQSIYQQSPQPDQDSIKP